MTERSETNSLSVLPLAVGTGQALAASVGISVVLATLFYFTNLSDSYMMPVVNASYGVCSLWAGWVAARRGGSKGLIYGFLAGLIFFIVTLAMGYLVSVPAYPMTTWWKKLLYAIMGGTAGGIAGVAWKG